MVIHKYHRSQLSDDDREYEGDAFGEIQKTENDD